MKSNADITSELFNLNDADYTELGQLLYQKDYTADALSYLSNHSRILNYWGEGEFDLLPSNSSIGRRKFSFLDLVWLGIVKEARDFGMEKEAIYILKKELLDTSDKTNLIDLIKTNRKEVEKSLRIQLGANSLQVKAIIEELMQKHHTLDEMNLSRLYNITITAIAQKEPIYLLINKEGSHSQMVERNFAYLLDNSVFSDFFRKPHLSICINSIVSFFLSKDYIKDTLKQTIFSKQEWDIIELIRKERPQSVTIYFNALGETESFDVTKKVHLQLEARLSEIMTKGGYEKMEIVTQAGRIVQAKKTKKQKL